MNKKIVDERSPTFVIKRIMTRQTFYKKSKLVYPVLCKLWPLVTFCETFTRKPFHTALVRLITLKNAFHLHVQNFLLVLCEMVTRYQFKFIKHFCHMIFIFSWIHEYFFIFLSYSVIRGIRGLNSSQL